MAPSETPSRKPPGIYNTGNCVSYVYGDFLHVEFCVQSVEILYDYSMVFTVSWSIQYSQGVTPSPDNPVHKGSDYNNRNMYIIDNLGNRYDHFTAGGGASGAIVTHGDYLVGTFTFPPAVPGAYIFTFYDDDQGVHTHGIELTNPIKLYENLVLAYSPFTLRYPLQHWQSGVNEDGNGILTHLKIPNCVIFEAPPSVPHGALINTIDIGLTTYQIFRYYEQDFSVREYLAIKNPDEINLDEQPHLNAHIPYDDSIVCLTDVGEVLAHLETKSTTNP